LGPGRGEKRLVGISPDGQDHSGQGDPIAKAGAFLGGELSEGSKGINGVGGREARCIKGIPGKQGEVFWIGAV
jgi:hypothetical protein